MSRHRNIRNRAYSYDDDYDDDDYYEEEEPSPTNAYMYRRNSPSRNQSLFQFIEQPKEDLTIDDADLIQPRMKQIQEMMGSGVKDEVIIEQLRAHNYDVDATVVKLMEAPRTTNIVMPSLETVAIGVEESKPTIATIAAVQCTESKPKKPVKAVPTEEEKTQKNPVKNSSEVVLTATEKLAFEKAELKAQEHCQKMNQDAKDRLSMVVIGHVDAGKSTIMGHLLYRMGHVSQRVMHKYEKESKQAGKSSFAFAWVMDADEEERSRGVTMDVGMSYFETNSKHITLLDAPGHRDFIPKMIAGASQADVAVLVVPASKGEFEAAFENSGQTKEHTLLVRSLGVTQMIIAVNKMDSVEWSKERYDYIQESLSTFLNKSGFKLKNLWFVPVSGLLGENLFEKIKDNPAANWYTGDSLLDTIDMFSPPSRPLNRPFRMNVSDVFKSMSLGNAVSGRIFAGAVAVGDKLLLMPLGERVTIKGIERDGTSISAAQAGDNAEIGVTGIDPSVLTAGSILCSIANPVKLVRKFQAQIMTMPSLVVPIMKGSCFSFHIHSVDEPVHVTKLQHTLSRTGDILKKKPRHLTRDANAIVEITSRRPMCLELYAEYRQLGRFTLRDRGVTLAAGIITKIL